MTYLAEGFMFRCDVEWQILRQHWWRGDEQRESPQWRRLNRPRMRGRILSRM